MNNNIKKRTLFYFAIVVVYANIYGFFKDLFNLNIPGLGFLIRNIKEDLILKLNGNYIYFNYKVGGCYGRHFAGDWDEPETHIFFKRLFLNIQTEVCFVDVGANVGEMIHDVSSYKTVTQIFAFEPIPDCALAINRTCKINGVEYCHIIEKLVGASQGICKFYLSPDVSNSSVIPNKNKDSNAAIDMEITTLDHELNEVYLPTLLLIDVEGMELEVMKGGLNFIERIQPIIIFEYNKISRNSFSIIDVQMLLGVGYRIFRLRKDGRLDNKLATTWNCVAIPINSNFDIALTGMIVEE